MVQNLTNCLYQTELGLVTVTWCRTPMSGRFLNFTVHPHLDSGDEEDDEAATVSHRLKINPWLFWKKKGKKKICVKGRKARLYWDLSKARFSSSPEPDKGFYLCLVSDRKTMVLLVGDLRLQAYARTRADPPSVDPTILSRREHVVGRRLYAAKASFGDGKARGIVVEWEPDEPGLSFQVDGKPVLKVHRLAWKFRGNDRFVVDGVPVHVYWDVHNWLFESGFGHAVFMFQPERIGPSSVSETGWSPARWPGGFTLNGRERSLLKTGSFSSHSSLSSSSGCSSSVLEWANTDSIPNSGGFSLVVYAWRA